MLPADHTLKLLKATSKAICAAELRSAPCVGGSSDLQALRSALPDTANGEIRSPEDALRRGSYGFDHCRHRTTVVFAEFGCHARCLGCGVLDPGFPSSEAARQGVLIQGPAPASRRY